MSNLATKEVFDDVCSELAMAILQFFQGKPPGAGVPLYEGSLQVLHHRESRGAPASEDDRPGAKQIFRNVSEGGRGNRTPDGSVGDCSNVLIFIRSCHSQAENPTKIRAVVTSNTVHIRPPPS